MDSHIIQSGPFKGKRIELAPTSGVETHEVLLDEFMHQIFGFEPGDCLLTDESSLRDFYSAFDGDERALYRKISERFQIIPESEILVKICEQIKIEYQKPMDYNALIPPSNAKYDWKQLLCYYCNQPIYETTPEAGYRNRISYPKGRWLHGDTMNLHCVKEQIRPSIEIDPPRCHCCSTQTSRHKMHCSIGGMPRYSATPMSGKEEELINIFGWNVR